MSSALLALVTFNSFPVAARVAAKLGVIVQYEFPQLSILSQLQLEDPSVCEGDPGEGLVIVFQFFPSCSMMNTPSLGSPVQTPAFNSFPVAAWKLRELYPAPEMEFLSILSQLQLRLWQPTPL